MARITEYRIIPELRLIMTTYAGDIIIQDFVNLTRRFIRDEAYNKDYNVLVDISQANGIAFRLDVVDYVEFIKKNVTLTRNVKVGILIHGLNQEFLMKFYRTFGGLIRMDINYFRERNDYFQWMSFTQDEILLADRILDEMLLVESGSTSSGS